MEGWERGSPRSQDTRQGYLYHGRRSLRSRLVHGRDTPGGYPCSWTSGWSIFHVALLPESGSSSPKDTRSLSCILKLIHVKIGWLAGVFHLSQSTRKMRDVKIGFRCLEARIRKEQGVSHLVRTSGSRMRCSTGKGSVLLWGTSSHEHG